MASLFSLLPRADLDRLILSHHLQEIYLPEKIVVKMIIVYYKSQLLTFSCSIEYFPSKSYFKFIVTIEHGASILEAFLVNYGKSLVQSGKKIEIGRLQAGRKKSIPGKNYLLFEGIGEQLLTLW